MKNDHLLTENNLFKGSFLPYTSFRNRKWEMVTKDVWVYTNRIVNICIIENENKELIMIDAGMPKDDQVIMKDIIEKYNGRKPIAIILTHGHFDHVGSLARIATEWGTAVYASEKELPYLTGMENYPKGKMSMKGLVAMLSKTFPNRGINLDGHISSLPEDRSVPHLDGWEWMYTPGHTPGHISLYNRESKILIAGDAVVTVKQESLFNVLTQRYSLNGPPAYFTPDQVKAKKSIVQLLQRPIHYLVTGHGPVIRDESFIEKEIKKLLKS